MYFFVSPPHTLSYHPPNMVSTRSASLRLSSPPTTKPTITAKSPTSTKPSPAKAMSPPPLPSASPRAPAPAWSHTPSRLTLLWLAVSLPLVVWDTLYILLRPRTMPGGALHWPLWVPYALYGEVDHVYGWVAFHARDGFTAAQGSLNAVETAMSLFYLWEVLRGSSSSVKAGVRRVGGRVGGRAVLVGFSAAVMTLSKTVLYCEFFFFFFFFFPFLFSVVACLRDGMGWWFC